jgi:hypothetical protein
MQIKNTISRTLELTTGSYTQWHNMMELAVEEYSVLDHLTEDVDRSHPNKADRRLHLSGADRDDH